MSKQHFHFGVIQVFSYFVPNKIETNFYGKKTREEFQLRSAEVFAGCAVV